MVKTRSSHPKSSTRKSTRSTSTKSPKRRADASSQHSALSVLSSWRNLLPKPLNNKWFASVATVGGLIVGWWALQNANGKPIATTQRGCLEQFYQATAPELVNVKLRAQTYPLCFNGFNVQYSGISRTSLWVAEKLTPARVSVKIKREDNFHEETRLPESVRSRLEDYRGSGYDRGHMAPNGDMSDTVSQFDSFSLANIVPQTPENNQNTWREIEESVRTMTGRYQTDIYVVTGPAFLDDQVRTVKRGRPVLVPSHIYKAIYMPALGIASAYVAPNDQSYRAQIVSICALEEKIGINLFPQVAEQEKRQIYALPLRANTVKSSRTPELRDTDNTSQCAPQISTQQIQSTQSLFSQRGGSSATGQATATSDSTAYPGGVNQVVIPLLKWIKQL